VYVYNVDTLAEHLGALEQAVLLALVRPQTALGKEAYGRAILKEVQHRLDRDVAAGAVYATLDRLEVKGLASSRLGPGTPVRGGRPKRHYAITSDGLRALNNAKAAMDRLWSGVRMPLKGTS
jgi:DNA-binding PadR family transcriptional regulator